MLLLIFNVFCESTCNSSEHESIKQPIDFNSDIVSIICIS